MVGVNRPIVCPRDPTWLRRMLEVLPPGLRGKLEPFEGCLTSSSVPQKSSLAHRRNVIHPVVR